MKNFQNKQKENECIKVSVIVPVYKVDRYLIQCINSIINQSLKEIEIIIIDEGEMDRCREIIDFFQKNDSRIIAPHKKNGGYGSSCNLGISIARGEYLAIVESDDFIEQQMYERLYILAKKYNSDVVKGPYIEYFSETDTKRDCHYRDYIRNNVPLNINFSVKDFGCLLEVHASLWAAIYKTEYLKNKNIRFIEAKGGAYVDVGFRIDTLIHTNKILWVDEPFYNYRVDAMGSSTNNFKLMPMVERWREVHEKYKYSHDFIAYYYPHLIIDEYLNTVGWIKNIPATMEQIEAISYNFQTIPIEAINTSVLNDIQKKEVLLCRDNYNEFAKKFSKYRKSKKINELINIYIKLISKNGFRSLSLILAVFFLCLFINENSMLFFGGAVLFILMYVSSISIPFIWKNLIAKYIKSYIMKNI